jgi:hypothetical protein
MDSARTSASASEIAVRRRLLVQARGRRLSKKPVKMATWAAPTVDEPFSHPLGLPGRIASPCVREILGPAERIDQPQLLNHRTGRFQKPRRGDNNREALSPRDRHIQPVT